jgi:hypothetical protein
MPIPPEITAMLERKKAVNLTTNDASLTPLTNLVTTKAVDCGAIRESVAASPITQTPPSIKVATEGIINPLNQISELIQARQQAILTPLATERSTVQPLSNPLVEPLKSDSAFLLPAAAAISESTISAGALALPVTPPLPPAPQLNAAAQELEAALNEGYANFYYGGFLANEEKIL